MSEYAKEKWAIIAAHLVSVADELDLLALDFEGLDVGQVLQRAKIVEKWIAVVRQNAAALLAAEPVYRVPARDDVG